MRIVPDVGTSYLLARFLPHFIHDDVQIGFFNLIALWFFNAKDLTIIVSNHIPKYVKGEYFVRQLPDFLHHDGGAVPLTFPRK